MRGSRGGAKGALAPPPPHKILLPQIVRRGPRGPWPPPPRGAKRALAPPLTKSWIRLCSWTFTSTHTPPPPLDIARMTSSTFRGFGGGGGVIGPGHARTLCCIGYSINITRSQRTRTGHETPNLSAQKWMKQILALSGLF